MRRSGMLILVGWILVVGFFLSLAACAGRRTPVKSPIIEDHQTFAIRIVDDETFVVSITSPQGEADAKEYLCTKSYICLREDLPVRVYKINRKRK